MSKVAIIIRYNRKSYFLGTVRAKLDQLVLDLSTLGGGEHYTFHRNKKGPVTSTHWSNNHPGSTWDEYKVEAARKAKYKNPEKHAKYLHHMPLQFSTSDGLVVGSRRIAVTDLKEKPTKSEKSVLDVDNGVIWLDIFFSLKEPVQKNSLAIKSEFGWLVLKTRVYSESSQNVIF